MATSFIWYKLCVCMCMACWQMGRLSHFNDTSFIYYSSDITFDMFESIVSEFLTVNLLFNIMFVGGAFFLEMCSALPSLRRLEKSCQFLFLLLLCWLAKLLANFWLIWNGSCRECVSWPFYCATCCHPPFRCAYYSYTWLSFAALWMLWWRLCCWCIIFTTTEVKICNIYYYNIFYVWILQFILINNAVCFTKCRHERRDWR